MRILPLSATDKDILDVAREWTDLLATDAYDRALELVDPGPNWTPSLLRSVISNYGSVQPRTDHMAFRVTARDAARGEPAPRHHVDRRNNRIAVWFDLPLNDAWSDLTATFDVVENSGGLVLRLDDVHVM